MSAATTDISSIPSDLSDRVKGSGLFYVRSRVAPSAKDVLSEATFLRWYEEHAEEVIAKSGIHSLFRYNAIGRTSASDASKPFLTTPVLDDIGFLLSEEFKGISPTSTILPGTGNVYDLVEFDINYLALRKSLVSKKGYKGPAKSIVTIEIQPPKDVNADAIDALSSKHVRTLKEEPTYTRSLIFESCFSFASAGGKKPVVGDLGKQHEIPSWVIIHTFSSVVDVDVAKRVELDLRETDGSIGTTQVEVRLWSLSSGFGEKQFFD